jgi:RNA polymerase sigma-70 factor (ECF subfamily)
VTPAGQTGRADPGPDEAQLVRRAKSGDAEAFGKLYDISFDRLYRYVFFRVGDPQTAEDITSEVFLRAWENLDRYKPRGPFVAWLYTIARNAVIDHYRSQRPGVPLDAIATTIGRDDRMDEKIELEHQVQVLQRALQHLTEDQHEVLTMKFIAELDTSEIARRLGKSEGAVRALQMRALQSLAVVMKNERR